MEDDLALVVGHELAELLQAALAAGELLGGELGELEAAGLVLEDGLVEQAEGLRDLVRGAAVLVGEGGGQEEGGAAGVLLEGADDEVQLALALGGGLRGGKREITGDRGESR